MRKHIMLQGALVKADIEFDVLPVYPNEREECMSVHICRQAGSEQSAIDACDVDARVNRPSMPMGRSQEDSSTINGLGGCRGEMWKSEVPVPLPCLLQVRQDIRKTGRETDLYYESFQRVSWNTNNKGGSAQAIVNVLIGRELLHDGQTCVQTDIGSMVTPEPSKELDGVPQHVEPVCLVSGVGCRLGQKLKLFCKTASVEDEV